MAHSALGTFISSLDLSCELSRISVPVDPIFEIAALTNRICKQPDGGQALLFERPVGSDFAVATNLFGSSQRVCRALRVAALTELTGRMNSLLSALSTPDLGRLDRQLAELPGFSRYTPCDNHAEDQELVVMQHPDAERFPFLHSWPGDGAAAGCGRYITMAQVVTTAPDGSAPNTGLYRVQVRGTRELAIQWKTGSGAARHAELYRQAGLAMPVALVLGGDPALLFSAMMPLPGALDETIMAGFLRGASLTRSACRTVPLQVPDGAEIVIEGFIAPGATVMEGPFGNHTGCYSPAAPAALLNITAIRYRPDAVVPATVVGPPPMEDCWMIQAWQRLLLALLQAEFPCISELLVPHEWAFHQSAVIFLENIQSGMVGELVQRLWTLPWFANARMLLFCDSSGAAEDVSFAYANWRAINGVDSSRDVYCDQPTGRLALDATCSRLDRQKLPSVMAGAASVARRWKEYGLA